MPTIPIPGPYTFRFYSNENNEPPHVHVYYGKGKAKFWLDPVDLAYARRLAPHRVGKVQSAVTENRDLLLGRWHEHFGHGS